MNAASQTDRPWMRRTGFAFAGKVDGGTVAVLLLWVLLLFILPVRRVADDTVSPPAPVSMIAAWPLPLSSLPLALRPDLVALPSAVSFGADVSGADDLVGVPSFTHRMAQPLPPPAFTAGMASDASDYWAAHMRISAVRELRRAGFSDLRLDSPSGMIPVSPPVRTVYYAGHLKNTRLNTEALKEAGILAAGRRMDLELWVAFDAVGRPVEIFLEKGSGDPATDRELVRRLWNPAFWSNAEGQGRIRIQ